MCALVYMQAPLGVFLKDENKLDEMVDILQELQRYAPSVSQTTKVHVPNSSEVKSLREIASHQLLLGGDQLTAKRARAGVRIRNNSTNGEDRLEGLLPVAEDWHAKAVLLEVSRMTLIFNMVQGIRLFPNLQVIWKRLYRLTSSSDIGTMFQLQNIVNRKNIGKSPKKDVNAHEDFFQ